MPHHIGIYIIVAAIFSFGFGGIWISHLWQKKRGPVWLTAEAIFLLGATAFITYFEGGLMTAAVSESTPSTTIAWVDVRENISPMGTIVVNGADICLTRKGDTYYYLTAGGLEMKKLDRWWDYQDDPEKVYDGGNRCFVDIVKPVAAIFAPNYEWIGWFAPPEPHEKNVYTFHLAPGTYREVQ